MINHKYGPSLRSILRHKFAVLFGDKLLHLLLYYVKRVARSVERFELLSRNKIENAKSHPRTPGFHMDTYVRCIVEFQGHAATVWTKQTVHVPAAPAQFFIYTGPSCRLSIHVLCAQAACSVQILTRSTLQVRLYRAPRLSMIFEVKNIRLKISVIKDLVRGTIYKMLK